MSEETLTAVLDAEKMIEPWESFSAVPYLDPAGVPTIGYGSIWDYRGGTYTPPRVTMDTPPIDMMTAKIWVLWELRDCVRAIAGDVAVALTHEQETALLDFCFNLGTGAFASSTLLRKLNAGDMAGAAAEFDKWSYAGGKQLAGLLRRRLAEKALFQSAT